MNRTKRFSAIFSIILACVVVGILLVLPTKAVQAQSNSTSIPQLHKSIPDNPKSSIPTRPPEEEFGQFAWETFVALNWPADCSNGQPKEETLGQNPDAPRVWEFYQYPEDIFQDNGEEPNPQLVKPPQCQNQQNLSRSVARNLRITEFASNSILQPTELMSDPNLSILLPGHEPLVDRAGNYILNEARMNSIEVKQIVNNGWYSAKNLVQFDNQFNDQGNPFELMCSNKELYPDPTNSHSKVPCSANDSEGVIELKVAWMVFPTPVPDQLKSKYYTTTRTFNVKTVNGDKTVTAPIGLVGFHIVQKTSRQGWIWSTFEHKDNAPDDMHLNPPEMDHYSLYDKDCTTNCEKNTPHATEPYLWRDEFPHAVTKIEGNQIVEQNRSQITRLVPISDIVKKLNEKWQMALADVSDTSVWQNYQLIGVQWLGSPYVPYETEGNLRRVKPLKLANVTLEPYVQKSELGSSCIACHTHAVLPPAQNVKADFSFLIGHAQ